MRKPKRKHKLRGQRTHGRGNTKNGRGNGNRGGCGLAGVDKHKWSWAMNIDSTYFSKVGFTPPRKRFVPVVHLYEINQKAILEKLDKAGNKYKFEFKGKVLGTGKVTVPLLIKATTWSKSVEKKLAEAGGEISKIEA